MWVVTIGVGTFADRSETFNWRCRPGLQHVFLQPLAQLRSAQHL